tara:strand:+ start:365 stop:790 length:426 start_codon:yes stop_codon:yes gene_type:complete
MTPEELSMWTLFNSGRIAGALGLIASAIFIWLGFRVATGTRAPISGESTTRAAQILSTIFCLGTCMGAWRIWSEGYATYTLAVRGLENLKDSGISLTDTAEEFIGVIGTSEVTNTPEPLGILFIIIIAIMYLSIIWVPKQA